MTDSKPKALNEMDLEGDDYEEFPTTQGQHEQADPLDENLNWDDEDVDDHFDLVMDQEFAAFKK